MADQGAASLILLGIDTCGSTGTLTLGRAVEAECEPLAEVELAGRTTAAMLIPTLDRMLREAGLAMAAVSGIVVVDGPGSFTGIRIGLSAAKGLAEALGIRVFAVSRLRVLSAVGEATSALLDAGRGEFYYGDEVGAEWLLTLNEVDACIATGARPVACEAKVVAAIPAARLVRAPAALDAIRVALPAALRGQCVDVATLDGRYVRRSDLYRTSAEASLVPGA